MLAHLLWVSTFPGGSANDFAQFLYAETGRNVVIAQSYLRPVEQVQLDAGDFEALARQTRMKTHLRFPPGADMVLQDELLPPHRMSWVTIKTPVKEPKWAEFTNPKGGKVTFSTIGEERLDAEVLQTAKFSKPVRVHWMLTKYPLSVTAKDMPEKQFLSYVAKATGGALQETQKEFRLELDPDQLRRRALNMLDLARKNDPWIDYPEEGARSRIDLMSAILRDMSKGDLLAAFKTPDSSTSATLRTSSETARVLMAHIRSNPSGYDARANALRTPAGLVHLADMADASVTLKASFHGNVSMNFKTEDGKSLAMTFELGR